MACITALKPVDEVRKRTKESSATVTAAAAFIKQLQEAAKKLAEAAALPEDLQEGQDDISNSSDRESSDREPRLIGDI